MGGDNSRGEGDGPATQRVPPQAPAPRKSGAFLWTAEDGPPPEDAFAPPADVPPAPMAPPPAASALSFGEDDDDDDLQPTLPPRQVPPAAPSDPTAPLGTPVPAPVVPRQPRDEPETRHVARESEKLEVWLAHTMAHGIPPQSEAERLDADDLAATRHRDP